jgi:hypothetical protein
MQVQSPNAERDLMSTAVDTELVALQDRWSPGWKIWRARRSVDPADIHEGSFVASRMEDDAGVVRTLVQKTAEAMHTALEAQARAVANGNTTAPEPPLFS